VTKYAIPQTAKPTCSQERERLSVTTLIHSDLHAVPTLYFNTDGICTITIMITRATGLTCVRYFYETCGNVTYLNNSKPFHTHVYKINSL